MSLGASVKPTPIPTGAYIVHNRSRVSLARLPIEVQLPLAVVVVLLIVLAVFAWSAYSAIKRASLDAADTHFDGAARQLVAVLQAGRPKPTPRVVSTATDPDVKLA